MGENHDIGQRVSRASMGYTLSIENLLQVGFNHFRSAPGILIIYSIVAAVALSNPVSGLLLGGPLVTGYYIAVLRLRNNGRVEFADLFKGFDQFRPLFLLNLLVSAVVLLGFMLLVIPGIYFSVSYLFSHFFYLIHLSDRPIEIYHFPCILPAKWNL